MREPLYFSRTTLGRLASVWVNGIFLNATASEAIDVAAGGTRVGLRWFPYYTLHLNERLLLSLIHI